jgi:hypothetical protein
MRQLHSILIAVLFVPTAAWSAQVTPVMAPAGVSPGSGLTGAEYRVTPGGLRFAFSDWLRASYLKCERASRQEGVLDDAAAARCAVIGSALKERVFGGDFERFTEWLKTTRDEAVAQHR